MRSLWHRLPRSITLTGREAGTIASVVSSGMSLPLPFHSCLLSFYAVDLPISHSLWRALGVTHTFLVHLIARFREQRCRNTLYFHGSGHMWFGDRLPIYFGDEAWEADLRLAKSFAP